MAHRISKREQAVLDYLESNSNYWEKMYAQANADGDSHEEWYLGHTAEAQKIADHVKNLITHYIGGDK